jgi:hypothetical protein
MDAKTLKNINRGKKALKSDYTEANAEVFRALVNLYYRNGDLTDLEREAIFSEVFFSLDCL